MALAGSIESFPLGAVMSLLESTTARGVLRFSDGVDMELHVDRGVAVGWQPAVSDDPVALVAGALATRGARFAWDDSATPKGGRAPRALTVLVAEAERLAADWREMREVAPSPAHRVVLDPDGDPAAVTLDAADWRTVCAAGTGPSLAELAVALSLPALETHRAVRRLLEGGLVRIEAPASAGGLPSVADAAPGGSEPEASPVEESLPPASDGGDDPLAALLAGAPALAAEALPGAPDEQVAPDDAGEAEQTSVPAADVPAADLSVAAAMHVDEALGDRGPWPQDQLRDLVEAAHRETGAALGTDAAVATRDDLPVGHRAAGDAFMAPELARSAPAATVDRGSLLRFFTTARA